MANAGEGVVLADASSALAEKLLQGWALLQEHCPQCLTPLVRNRQRKMYCVCCGRWVVSQSELAQQLLRERIEESDRRGPDNNQASPPPHPVSQDRTTSMAATAAAANPSESNHHIDADHNHVPAVADWQNHTHTSDPPRKSGNTSDEQEVAQTDDPHQRTDNTSDERGLRFRSCPQITIPMLQSHSSKGLDATLSSTISILTNKLEDIGYALTSSKDLHEIRELLCAVRECIQSIKDVKECTQGWTRTEHITLRQPSYQ